MLTMVHVTQVKLLAFEKNDCEAIQSQSAPNIIVKYPGTKVEPLVILACLGQLPLFFREFTHLEVDVSLLHEIALLNASLGFHDEVLGGFARCV